MKTLWTLLACVRSDEIDVVGQLGQDHLLASVDSESNWYWRPSAYGGWGYDCTARDIDDNCIWTWSHGDQKTWNEWRTIEQLDNVEQDENRNLWIKSLGLKDNRIYGLISPMSGKVLRSYVVKVGEAPSFPSEIKCITLIESLKMECTWEIDERQLLPWARTESSLNYQRAELSQVNEDQLSFNETDKLLPCPSGPCSSRSHGCCTFALRPSDIDRKKVITFRLEVISRNLFGERRMQRGNSQIIHVSPSQLIKPLAPVITNVTAPNLYDGSKLKVSIEDQNLTQSWVEPVYNYRAEYRLRGSTSWQSTALTTGDELTLSKLLPFKEYEIRVARMPVFSGFWSLPSQVVTAFTQPIEPTALLQPKFTVSEDKKVQFFWSVYHQRNAPGTAIRLQVLGKDCDEEDMPKQRLYDEKLNVTTTEVDISEIPSSVQCLEAAFSVVNDKGEKRSPLIFIDLRRGDLTVPAIVAETNEFGRLIIDLADREHIGNFGLDREMAILLCFTREGDLKGEPETCHVQHVTARQFPIESKATVTPCYNYNVYLQVEHQGMKLRSKPTQIKQSDTFQIKTGTIGSVSDKSSQSTPALEVIYQIEQPVHNLYDMHPVVSYRNKLNDFVYRKKVDPVKTRVTLNETVGDHLVGGGDVEVWLSLCCDEDSSSCHAHTDAKRLNLQPGLPGSVSDMAMIWRKEESAYKLQWNNPLKTNAPITGYHVIVQYPDIRFSKYPLQNSERTYYLNLQSSNELLLEDVCFTMFDQVNVTVAAYTLVGEKLTLGKPIDYQFSCSDLMVVGFSIGILSAIGLLIVIVAVMMILSYIHRQQLKTYVTGVVWPEMDKPIIHFPSAPSSRDEGNFSAAEETDRLLPTQIIKTDHFDTSEKVAEQNDQFDSGVSGSEYSGSGKSLPIYRLGYRLDFRRGSHASSGISSGGNSIKTADTNIHSLMSSNHSGDSMLAKSVRSQNNQKFQLPSPIQKPAFAFADLHLPTVAPDLTVNRLTYVHQEPVTGYSIMDKNFGLTSRPADMDTQMDYVGHGYVENTVFNMNNMPTAFLESFKKLKGFKPAVEQPMDYNNQFDASQSDYMSQYEGYKPISALIPPQDDKSETIVPLASKFSMPVFQSKAVPVSPMSHLMPNFDDDYPISNLIPTKFKNSGSSTQASISDYRTDYDDGYHIGMPSIPTKAASGYTGTSGYSTGESMDAPGAKVPNDGYVADDGYNAGLIMNPGGYVCDQAPCSFTPPPAPVQQPQVSGYLPFNRAMQTFGIDESIPDEYLLSSRLAAFQGVPPSQEHMIPVSYVSGYTSDVFMTIPEKKHVPGYVSIEGAQLLQQS